MEWLRLERLNLIKIRHGSPFSQPPPPHDIPWNVKIIRKKSKRQFVDRPSGRRFLRLRLRLRLQCLKGSSGEFKMLMADTDNNNRHSPLSR